jgi:hypothetical protein
MRRRSISRRRDRGGAAAGGAAAEGGATPVSSSFKQQINISKYIKIYQINHLSLTSSSNQLNSTQIILGSF